MQNDFKKFIDEYKDFPKKNILFRDISPLLLNPEFFDKSIKEMSKSELFKKADAIIGIDARGFIFGTALSLKLSMPLILARKIGKLPGKLIKKSYDLEYGKNTLCIQEKSINSFNSFVIVDDLLATGGTVLCVYDIIKEQKKEIIGLSTLVELEELGGRKNLPFSVESLIKY